MSIDIVASRISIPWSLNAYTDVMDFLGLLGLPGFRRNVPGQDRLPFQFRLIHLSGNEGRPAQAVPVLHPFYTLLEVHLTASDCRQDSDLPDTRKRLKGLVSVDFLIQRYTLIRGVQRERWYLNIKPLATIAFHLVTPTHHPGRCVKVRTAGV